ncbi:MAG: HAD-IIB family hydrolase, partial [Sarcina sp.]
MYKLMAIDMDGTLLTENKTISENTKEALKKAKDNGVKVVLATGRPVDGVTRYLEELELTTDHDYVLSFNGAIVQNVGTRQIICRDVLKGSDLQRLYNVSKEVGVNIHAFSTKGLITPVMSKYTDVEATINNIKVDIVDFSTIKDDEDMIKIMMIDEPEVLEAAISKLPKELYEDYTVVRSTPY